MFQKNWTNNWKASSVSGGRKLQNSRLVDNETALSQRLTTSVLKKVEWKDANRKCSTYSTLIIPDILRDSLDPFTFLFLVEPPLLQLARKERVAQSFEL
jgi:hypothetical protein